MDIPRFTPKVRHAVRYMLVCVCLVVLLCSLFSKYYLKALLTMSRLLNDRVKKGKKSMACFKR